MTCLFYRSQLKFKLDRRTVTRQTGSKRRKVLDPDKFYYIPILSTLKQLMQVEAVKNEIFRDVVGDHLLHDFRDGEAFKTIVSLVLTPKAYR